MGCLNFALPASLGPWKIPAALALVAALLVPAWQQHLAMTDSAAIPAAAPLINLAKSDTVIMYAAPVNADPVLRISTRDVDGNWQEAEMQLSQDHPVQSAKIVKAVVARETANQISQP